MPPPEAPRSPSSPSTYPQAVDASQSSSRASPTEEMERSSPPAERKPPRPLPQPVETSHSKNSVMEPLSHARLGTRKEDPITSTSPSLPQLIRTGGDAGPQKPRKFAPQMIETTRRRRKSTDTTPCLPPSDKTDFSPTHQAHLPPRLRQPRPGAAPIVPDNSPITSTDHVPQVPESKFSSSKLAEKKERRYSFRVPTLPAIPSLPGTESNNSTSPSADSDQTELGVKEKSEDWVRRASEDVQWSGYLLALAAKTAEKQLLEQAMAAYPNEHDHEPVDHYAFDRDSDEAEVEAGVGIGTSMAGWAKTEMRKHQAELGLQKRSQLAAASSDVGRRRSTRRALQEPENPYDNEEIAGAPPKSIIGWQKDNEMKPMQKAASPPMAGGSLQFPKCQSPQATRLDVHQYPGSKRHEDVGSGHHSGLWTPGGGASRKASLSGLWNGVCNVARQEALVPAQVLQSGLLTPALERNDPFSGSTGHGNTQLPPSPPSSQEETSGLDNIVHREQSIEAELNDAFITQVYNYLSLGYPSMARKFDQELSKITRISVEDLRKDDEYCNAKGYVGAPEGMGTDARDVMEGERKCERWCALRSYVREWGRQQPGMGTKEEMDGGWAVGARKGSWGL